MVILTPFVLVILGASSCYPCPAGYSCTRASVPDVCPAGYYCPAKTGFNIQPCPVGTFGRNHGLKDVNECTQCSAGHYCQFLGKPTVTGPCDGGYFCKSGVNTSKPYSEHTGEGGVCYPGHECPVGTGTPKPCKPGYYATVTQRENCSSCPKGKYCNGSTIYPADCPVGHYCPSGTKFATEYPCPTGTFNNKTSQTNEMSCQLCLPGYYCEGEGRSSPTGLCDPGYYCSGGSSIQRPVDRGVWAPTANDTSCYPQCVCPMVNATTGGICPLGHYCPVASKRPQPCKLGMYCNNPGLAKPTGNCTAGYYCNGGSSVPDQYECPMGRFCPQGTGVPFLCPNGTFANTTKNTEETDCQPCKGGFYCAGTGNINPTGKCDPNYYCPGGQTEQRPSKYLCPAGHYCKIASAAPQSCWNGSYQNDTGQDSCNECPPGYYCNPALGPVINPIPCPPGSYCPKGTTLRNQFLCPKGTFYSKTRAISENGCIDCPVGKFCGETGLSKPSGDCFAGYYCLKASTNPYPVMNLTTFKNFTFSYYNDRCPPGYYCESGTKHPENCPAGTFSTMGGIANASDCEPCAAGRYCSSAGPVQSAEPPKCSAGYVCVRGSNTPTPTDGIMGYMCPKGFKCPKGGTTKLSCEPGSYQPDEGQRDCIPCPAGKMCLKYFMTTPDHCQIGYYCPDGKPLPCPTGTYSKLTGLVNVTQCSKCPAGNYCPGENTTSPHLLCEAGWFCEEGASSATPSPGSGAPNNGPCKKGSYCEKGTKSPTNCPRGTFRNTTGARSISDCLDCRPGYYCERDGLEEPTGECEPGYYCPEGSKANVSKPIDYQCTIGHYCPKGSAVPLPCPEGQYQPDKGKWQCTKCPAGYYCRSTNDSNKIECPEGNYCPEGSSYKTACPSGTYSRRGRIKLTKASDCDNCIIGSYCRGGKILGQCAAGYYCRSGSPDPNPQNSSYTDAFPCPMGYYCPNGTVSPPPCPNNTLKDYTGGIGQLSDCSPCPSGKQCFEGDGQAYPCPAGSYCEVGKTGPERCPVGTYRNEENGENITDCFPCPAGYHCNITGIGDITGYECPVGYYCLEGQSPTSCPPGKLRDNTGAKSASECHPCKAGYYCPEGRPNVDGVPCNPGRYCNSSEGSALERMCPGGHYCPAMTAVPNICPAGYYCPWNSSSITACEYPYYCPEKSDRPLLCDLGYYSKPVAGNRTSANVICSKCAGGLYGNHPMRLNCSVCPSGYYCPVGTIGPHENPCPKGYYCPQGSHGKNPCPPGMYGNRTLAVSASNCYPCPENTFNNREGQLACRPCGSSAISSRGSPKCQCMGKYRSFQVSDGSCECLAGYVFYDEVNKEKTDGNSDLSCQPKVDERCSSGKVRLANSRDCIDSNNLPADFCKNSCGDAGENGFDVELGRCRCKYKAIDEICDKTCMASKPQLVLQRNNETRVLQLITKDSDGVVQNIDELDVDYGYADYDNDVHHTEIVQVQSSGINGYLVTNSTQSPLQQLVSPTSTPRRVRRAVANATSNTSLPTVNKNAGIIPNPFICLEIGSSILFKIELNNQNRSLSHYPRYNKDHLFNQNDRFDYGNFRLLHSLIQDTNKTVPLFANVFAEAGVFVFYDNAEPSHEMIVKVTKQGEKCQDGINNQLLPSSTTILTGYGVAKSEPANLAPNWPIIYGLTAFMLICVLMLLIATIIWRPKNFGHYSFRALRPKYKSLGAPIPVVPISGIDDIPEELGPRGVAEGAPSYQTESVKFELENFNVRTLFDKLEDQTLHVTSQLARHQADLRGFYERISQQAENLKQMLNNMDVSALIQATKEAAASANPDVSIDNAKEETKEMPSKEVAYGSRTREEELMKTLQMLIEKIETGYRLHDDSQGAAQFINVGTVASSSSKLVEHDQLVSLSDTSNIGRPQGVGQAETTAMWDVVKKLNNERIRVDQELRDEEQAEIRSLLGQEELRRAGKMQDMAEKLAEKLAGCATKEEMEAVMKEHDEEVRRLENALSAEKQQQMDSLKERLRKKREEREAALLQKQKLEAEKFDIDIKENEKQVSNDGALQHEANALNTIALDEATNLAKSEETAEEDEINSITRQMGDAFCDIVEKLGGNGALSADDAEEYLREHMRMEGELERNRQQRKDMQISLVREKLEKRKLEKMRKLKQKQELERAQAIEQGLDLTEVDRQHAGEREALEGEYEAEQCRHEVEITKRVNKEHVHDVKKQSKDLLEKIGHEKNVDPMLQQQILDQLRRENENVIEGLAKQKAQAMEATKNKIAARKARREVEARRLADDAAARRILEEQSKSVVTKEQLTTENIVVPDVKIPSESTEEKAVKKEQRRVLKEMKDRHEDENDKLNGDLINEVRQTEKDEEARFHSEKDKKIFQLQQRQAADLQARQDLSPAEMERLMTAHQQEIENLVEHMENDRVRQQDSLKRRLQEKRQQRLDALRRKHDREEARELLEQQKELQDVRTNNVKAAENDVIIQAIKDNGPEASELVIRKILGKRHDQEIKDLDRTFQEERRVGIDETLAKMEDEHTRENEEMQKAHAAVLKELENEDLNSDEFQQRKAQLLNKQQLEQSALERKQNEELRKLKTSATADWEVRYARAKLELKEKHYEEYADALSELSPEQSEAHKQSVEKALQAARELEEIKKKLEEEKRHNEEKQKRESEEFERAQKERLENALGVFDSELSKEEEEERKKHEKSMIALNARKEDLLREKKTKIKQEIAKMAQQGASSQDKDAILQEHSKDLAKLMNKLDADRMRMQSSLEERLKKKRQEKRKEKIMEVEKTLEEEKVEHEGKQMAETERLQLQEVLKLKESIQVDDLVADQTDTPPQDTQHISENQPPLPVTYRMAAPLNESEITSLLLQSPLYQKLESIKNLINDVKGENAPTSGESYTDIKDDTLWSSDENLIPVDLNKISGRTFVVYKFGCFVVDLLTVHCQHVPVTLLLAEKLPPNPHLSKNAYRNSFYFDSNNQILYMRKERLETVGEFVLVLIHCLAHLKAQDLRDDTNPSFVREFHRSLAVVCDDLFFARYRRSSVLTQSISQDGEEDLERISSDLLQSNLESSHSARSDVVGDLLDLKLLRGSSKDGVHFSQEGLMARLSNYSNFALSNKIQDMLGSIDEKTNQSQLQGTDIYIEDKLQGLRDSKKSDRPVSRFAQSRGNLISRDTAREFSRGMAVSRSTTPYPLAKKRPTTQQQSRLDEDLYRSFIQGQISDIQEKIDYLNEEFSNITLQLLEQNNNVEELEAELVSKADTLKNLSEESEDHAQQKALLHQTAVSLTSQKNLVEALELKKGSCVHRLQLFRKQLDEKSTQLAKYEQDRKQSKDGKESKRDSTVDKKTEKKKK